MYTQKAGRFKEKVPDLFLHKWVEKELVNRFNDLKPDTSLNKNTLVTNNFFYEPIESLRLSPFYHTKANGVINGHNLPFKGNQLNTWIDSMYLHGINHVDLYFKELVRVLKKEAWYISGFLGGESAKDLRYKLIEIEANIYGTASLRFFPTLRPDQIGLLTNWAGFKETIIECIQLSVSYTCLSTFINDIRATGENGVLLSPYFYQRILWKELEKCWDTLMPLELDVIIISART